ncbi:MAG TPA: hypothetical protein VH740_16965 [Vicinamibacterales bacterium]|jgi:hypothetical protein
MSIQDPARIHSRAALVLKELQGSPAWRGVLEKAALTTSLPMLVTSIAPVMDMGSKKRLRLPDYYIVSLVHGDAIKARFAHHAETGDLLEAEGARRTGAALRPYVDPNPIARSELLGAAPSAADSAQLAGQAVWRPCRESTSRFAPFWRFQFKGRTLYVRADGKTFSELTVTGRG